NKVLANAGKAFFVMSNKETLQLGVSGEPGQHIIGHRGNSVVASETRIEGFTFLSHRLRRREIYERNCGKDCQADIQKRRKSFHHLLSPENDWNYRSIGSTSISS